MMGTPLTTTAANNNKVVVTRRQGCCAIVTIATSVPLLILCGGQVLLLVAGLVEEHQQHNSGGSNDNHVHHHHRGVEALMKNGGGGSNSVKSLGVLVNRLSGGGDEAMRMMGKQFVAPGEEGVSSRDHDVMDTKEGEEEEEKIRTTTTKMANEIGNDGDGDTTHDNHRRPDYKRVGPDDDEIHDEEILKAVQRSLYEFYYKKTIVDTTTTSSHNLLAGGRGRGEAASSASIDSNGTKTGAAGLNKNVGLSFSHPSRSENLPRRLHRTKRGIKMVCYGAELGCFRDEGVFDYLDMVPASPDEIGTKFMVYTRRNHFPEVYHWDNYTSTRSSNFNASNPTKIIVHGFGSTCNRMWASEMRQALLAVVDCNVICVDWESGAALPNYVRAAVNTRLVGKQLSLFISALGSNHGARNEDVHVIGFSLGAHVAGFAGSELRNLSRITGLDPAGPLFESYDAKVRLDAGDAMFVDVIHSNGNSLLMGGLGSWEAIGHLDFYPNGGRAQKGCSHMFLGAFRDLIWSPSGSSSSSSTAAAAASSSSSLAANLLLAVPNPGVSSPSSQQQQPTTLQPPTILQPPQPPPPHHHIIAPPPPHHVPASPLHHVPPSLLHHPHLLGHHGGGGGPRGKGPKLRMRMLPMDVAATAAAAAGYYHHPSYHHHHHHHHLQHHSTTTTIPLVTMTTTISPTTSTTAGSAMMTTTTLPPETDGRSLCNHRRAYKFFTESVSPRCQFPAFFCESFDKYLTGTCFHGVGGSNGGGVMPATTYSMGYYADVNWVAGSLPVHQKNKLLYLATRDEEPFCANQYRIRVESSPSPAPISTYGGLEATVIGNSGGDESLSVEQLVNSTFLVTQSPKDNMVAGSVLQRLVVAHPALTNPVKINLKYSAYQGWLYSGISRWSMDRIVITDPRGVSSSFCTRGLLLPSGISVTVTLTPGLCTNHLGGPPLQPPPPPPPNNNFAAAAAPNYEVVASSSPSPSSLPTASNPNYPYETFGETQHHGNNRNTSSSKSSLSTVEYSEWQPILLQKSGSSSGEVIRTGSHGNNSNSSSSSSADDGGDDDEDDDDADDDEVVEVAAEGDEDDEDEEEVAGADDDKKKKKTSQATKTSPYVTKHVLPHDIDNLLYEHEVIGPGAVGGLPTRLLLGTTRSLKSRPIVLRNRAAATAAVTTTRVREGRGMLTASDHHHHHHKPGDEDEVVFLVPASPLLHEHNNRRANQNELRQVGIKMMMTTTQGRSLSSPPPPVPPSSPDPHHYHLHRVTASSSELGDVVSLPPGVFTSGGGLPAAAAAMSSSSSSLPNGVVVVGKRTSNKSHHHHFGLVALRRRKKSGGSRRRKGLQ